MKGDLRKVFGKALRRLREEHELSQQELADYCELERVYISKLERGLSMPSIDTVFKIASVLKMKPHELVKEIE